MWMDEYVLILMEKCVYYVSMRKRILQLLRVEKNNKLYFIDTCVQL